MSVVLTTVPCARCAAPCLATPAAWLTGLALCQRCRPAPVPPLPGTVPWRPTIARVLPGELGAIVAYDGRTKKERESAATQAVDRARMRVLVPAREATPDEIGRGVRAMVDQLQDGMGHQACRVTYSCAEDTERGELVRSVAVRVPAGGYAVWENDRWSSGLSAHPSPHLCGSLDEWINHVRGLNWTPPSCPRCGRVGVRMTQTGQPYKHKTINGEECA